MSTDKSDEDNAIFVLNGDDQPVLIAFDIEYHSVLCHETGVSVDGLDIRWALP